ncbi:MAG: hypothetical protein AAF363_17120 [Bacteroidota bacterium]
MKISIYRFLKGLFVFGLIFLPFQSIYAQVAEDEFAGDEVAEPMEESGDDRENSYGNYGIRKFLNRFTAFFSTGYGQYSYRHTLDGYAVGRANDTTYIINIDSLNISGANTAVFDWTTAPQIRNGLTVGEDSLFAADSIPIEYRGSGYSIPISLGLFYDYKQYRIGLGGTFEIHRFRPFEPSRGVDTLGTLLPTETSLGFFRYYLLLGYKFHKYKYFDFTGELQLGRTGFLGSFDNSAISSSIYANLGVNIERHFSEIFGVFVRPSIEFKRYTVETGIGPDIDIGQPAYFLNIGVTYKYPILPRCPVPRCHTQVNHVHVGKEYRSKRHKFFKWQNPKYGQNYPKLIQNKGRNKKIRDSY